MQGAARGFMAEGASDYQGARQLGGCEQQRAAGTGGNRAGQKCGICKLRSWLNPSFHTLMCPLPPTMAAVQVPPGTMTPHGCHRSHCHPLLSSQLLLLPQTVPVRPYLLLCFVAHSAYSEPGAFHPLPAYFPTAPALGPCTPSRAHSRALLVSFGDTGSEAVAQAEALTRELQRGFKRVNMEIGNMEQPTPGADDADVRKQVRRPGCRVGVCRGIHCAKSDSRCVRGVQCGRGCGGRSCSTCAETA